MPNPGLEKMISDAPDELIKIEDSLNNLSAQIADLEEKQSILEVDVCGKTANNLENYLIGNKFIPESDYFLDKGPTFNLPLISDGNLIDWKVFKIFSVGSITYISESSFECQGDYTEILTTGLDILLLNTEKVYSIISSSNYDQDFDITIVTLEDGILINPIQTLFIFHYSYLDGDDVNIDNFKKSWDYGHDHIIHPIGLTGTYGTQDMILKLNSAKNMLQHNKVKIEDSVIQLAKFV